jgi:hypothetical protein
MIRQGYLGPAHARCNAQAAAAKTNAARAETVRWSRRWHDEPPVGTEVFLGNGLVEIHVGRGIWQTVANQFIPSSCMSRSAQAALLIFGNECGIDQRINRTTSAVRIIG